MATAKPPFQSPRQNSVQNLQYLTQNIHLVPIENGNSQMLARLAECSVLCLMQCVGSSGPCARSGEAGVAGRYVVGSMQQHQYDLEQLGSIGDSIL
eukprot:793760-Amphidinium_carterae.1